MTTKSLFTITRIRGAAIALCLGLVVVVSANQDYRPSDLDLTVAPYKYGLVGWELSHFTDKWLHKLGQFSPWRSRADTAERRRLAVEFFRLGSELEELEHLGLPTTGHPDGPASAKTPDPAESPDLIELRMAEIREQRQRLQADVEETIEAEISAVLVQEGFSPRFGLIFPPVDTVFSAAPGVLILSPRDRIHRLKAIPLRPGLTDEEKDLIEDEILAQQDLAALVEGIGGIATFPSAVDEKGNMRHAVVTAAHEWLHHWFFFQPLGQGFWDGPQMTTLNETAATLGGREIGNRAYASLTGGPLEPIPDPALASKSFSYDVAILETRQRVDELLSRGKIQEAEAYMEQRRQLLVEQGFRIRKINQAFFAFRQAYATDPASTSPIAGQLKDLRDRSESLEEFLKTVAAFGSYQQFLAHLEGQR
ncbi:MAG: hypothetical protein BZY88_06930 [SAR202 cluster bacterium Io17-Chloro-G9]|nr:MAG: hypothetical protein BZY88_06930 [SAR202 cluster bacterium Io17-Chloro-G9]